MFLILVKCSELNTEQIKKPDHIDVKTTHT